MKTIYLHFHNDRNIKEVKTDDGKTIGGLIMEYLPIDSAKPDNEEDLEVYLENHDDDLSKDTSLEKLKIKDGDHLHFHRCRKVSVTIHFNGEVFSHNFAPANTITKVFKQAIKHFGISDVDGGVLSLFLNSACDEPIPGNEHIGSFTGYPTCSVLLYLGKKKNILG